MAQIDFDAIEYQKVQFLPPTFDGDVVFELPPCRGSVHSSSAKSMEGMDKRYDGHAWTRTLTSNINNNLGLKFRRSACVGHLCCENADCDYLKRTSKKNETEWTGTTINPFYVGLARIRFVSGLQGLQIDSILFCIVPRTYLLCAQCCR